MSIARDADLSRKDRQFGLGSRVLAGTALAFLLIAVCGGWAATAQLSGAVIAPGSIMVEDNLKTVQHRDGGIIGEIAVREGDFVRKGQVLLRLEDAQTRAELSIVEAQLLELSARRARLRAERDDLDAFAVPGQLAATSDEIRDIVNGELRLFEGNLRHRKSQKEQLALGIDQLGEEIRGLEAQRTAKLKELELVGHELAKIKSLADQGLIEANCVYAIEREMTRLLGEQGEVEAGVARAKARISEIRIQILAVDEAARTEAQRELSNVEPKITELAERRTAIEDRLSRTDIRSPLAGIVNELTVHTVGGVITPAETLVSLVPDDARLTITAKLTPTDIDQVHVGQSARLRFSAFNQRTTPELFGTVSYVSPATTVDKATGQPHYLARIEVADAELARLGDNHLVPGMPLEVLISTDERTALSYLAKPLIDQFAKAFREQ
jgi:HlyD family type I secretion membrane fusion protein